MEPNKEVTGSIVQASLVKISVTSLLLHYIAYFGGVYCIALMFSQVSVGVKIPAVVLGFIGLSIGGRVVHGTKVLRPKRK